MVAVVLQKQQQREVKKNSNDVLGVCTGLVGSSWSESDPVVPRQISRL